jgi:hypothetical protein
MKPNQSVTVKSLVVDSISLFAIGLVLGMPALLMVRALTPSYVQAAIPTLALSVFLVFKLSKYVRKLARPKTPSAPVKDLLLFEEGKWLHAKVSYKAKAYTFSQKLRATLSKPTVLAGLVWMVGFGTCYAVVSKGEHVQPHVNKMAEEPKTPAVSGTSIDGTDKLGYRDPLTIKFTSVLVDRPVLKLDNKEPKSNSYQVSWDSSTCEISPTRHWLPGMHTLELSSNGTSFFSEKFEVLSPKHRHRAKR